MQTFDMILIGGENRLKVIAYSKERVESNPVEIAVYYHEVVKRPVMYVLAVGIDRYRNERYNLNYAVADAEGYVQAIQQCGRKLYERIEA